MLIDGIVVRSMDSPDDHLSRGVRFEEVCGDQRLSVNLAKHLGKEIDKDEVLSIKNELLQNAKTFLAVHIPDQNVSYGVVQFVVLEKKAGTITASMNRWFSDRSLLKQLHIQPGQMIDEPSLQNDLAWLN